jgi:hypothetical protein
MYQQLLIRIVLNKNFPHKYTAFKVFDKINDWIANRKVLQ